MTQKFQNNSVVYLNDEWWPASAEFRTVNKTGKYYIFFLKPHVYLFTSEYHYYFNYNMLYTDSQLLLFFLNLILSRRYAIRVVTFLTHLKNEC